MRSAPARPKAIVVDIAWEHQMALGRRIRSLRLTLTLMLSPLIVAAYLGLCEGSPTQSAAVPPVAQTKNECTVTAVSFFAIQPSASPQLIAADAQLIV